MKNTFHFTKFAVLAFALGFVSPYISITDSSSLGLSGVNVSLLNMAEARDDNRNKNKNKNKNKNSNKNVNVNSNKNTNTNVNVNRNKNTNRNVNVNVNNNKHRGPRPLAILAGMAIGTAVVASAMSPSCTIVMVNGLSYKKCDGTYFQQSGTNYIVVKSPY